ncbi:MAG: hypothetical protein QM831_21235 [Kofleriaceae bacterium]
MKLLIIALSLTACATSEDGTDDAAEEITSANTWYHLDAANGLGPATLSVVNGYKVRCPDGHSSRTCDVTALVVPATCGFECKDGLLSLQGESIVRGSFSGTQFVIAEGLDTWSHDGLGSYSLYQLVGAATCAHDPCPTGLSAKKLNLATRPTAISSVSFAQTDDPNYVLDPTRGDAQIADDPSGMIVSGHIVNHVFRVDRTFRLETSHPACDPQLAARAHAYPADAVHTSQVRTVAEGERSTGDDDGSAYWLVRTAESATSVTFTSGVNDLWAQTFAVAKADCTITVLTEH